MGAPMAFQCSSTCAPQFSASGKAAVFVVAFFLAAVFAQWMDGFVCLSEELFGFSEEMRASSIEALQVTVVFGMAAAAGKFTGGISLF